MSLRRYVVSGLSALVLALTPSFSAFSGCGNDSSSAGCQDDAECKGDRICIDHKCVSSSEISNGDAGTSQPTCTSHASKVCSGSDVYWQNSCGSLEEVAQDCASGQYCNNAQCVNEAPVCTPHSSKICYDGDVYWQDSCGERQNLADDCGDNEVCENGVCKCAPRQSKICYNDDVYWVDGCGNRDYRAEDCENRQRCENAACVDISIFEDLGNGTVYYHGESRGDDLIIQKSPASQLMGYDNGITYCQNLSFGGKTNWEIPDHLPIALNLEPGNCFSSLFEGPCGAYWKTGDTCGNNRYVIIFTIDSSPQISCRNPRALLNVRCVADP